MSKKKGVENVDFSTSIGKQEGHHLVSIIDEYKIDSNDIPLDIKIYRKKGEHAPLYDVFIPSIGVNTRIVLEKIRQELVKSVTLGFSDLTDIKGQQELLKQKFKTTIEKLIEQYFPQASMAEKKFFVSYLLLRSIGLGEIEILMGDSGLEEIAINGASQPIWVYHRKYGWLKTNIQLEDDNQIRYFATTIGRKVGRQISMLEPLMDVTLSVGDRVNATLMPVSNDGNTITIRKFATKPWTITDFLSHNTLSYDAAALLWQAIQFELSILIAGGTASGKTSMLNALANFFPPNQRIISIEDTREVKLPKFLHWIPMLTRLPNAEGRGEVSMLTLLQNSLRMRPDRMLVGEIRKPAEAEVLFEAIHTGHSVYATVHANTAEEAVTRLTNPPINIPKMMMSALSLIIVQFRNRRTGLRRTFQIAEIVENGDANVLQQYQPKSDKMINIHPSRAFMKTIETFSGISRNALRKDQLEKQKVLKWLVKNNINTVEGVGEVIAEYYTDPKELMKRIK